MDHYWEGSDRDSQQLIATGISVIETHISWSQLGTV